MVVGGVVFVFGGLKDRTVCVRVCIILSRECRLIFSLLLFESGEKVCVSVNGHLLGVVVLNGVWMQMLFVVLVGVLVGVVV